jgi:hypothetical protein
MANMIQKINLLFLFLFYLKKIHHFGGPKHRIIQALKGLDRKKLIFSLLCYSCFAKAEVLA